MIQGHLKHLHRKRHLHAIKHSQPTLIFAASVPCTGCEVERDTGGEGGVPPHDVGWSSMAPLLTNAVESGEDGIGERECEVEFVSDVTHARILPSTTAEIQ
jgi:hypothetical protein